MEDVKTMLISYVSMDMFCVLWIAVISLLALSFWNKMRRNVNIWLIISTLCSALYILGDVAWKIDAYDHVQSEISFFVTNSFFFIPLMISSYAWLNYVISRLNVSVLRPFWMRILMGLPMIPVIYFSLTAISNHQMFYMGEGAEYVRGPMYFIFPLVNFTYVGLSALISLIYLYISRFDKENKNDKQKSLAVVFAISISANVFGALAQFLTNYNFCTLGTTISLIFYYIYLIYDNNRDHINFLQYRTRADRLISTLSADYLSIDYVEFQKNKENDQYLSFRTSDLLTRLVPDWDTRCSFTERLNKLEKGFVFSADRSRFRQATRREVILKKLENMPSYSVQFQCSDEAHDFYQLKMVPVYEKNELVGLITGLRNVTEDVKSEKEHMDKLESILTERTSELHSKNRSLNRMNEQIIELLGNTVEGRDVNSGEHIRRVKGFTYILARQVMEACPSYGLTMMQVELFAAASPLHDLGKIAIPDSILNKPGKLTPEEFEIMKTHTTKGVEILQKAPREWSDTYLATSMEIAQSHHEKWDGKGYPEGLKGDEIPLSAQIVAIADCYDAISTERPYKPAYPLSECYRMIMEGECGAFSPRLLDCFSKVREAFEKHAMDPSSVFETASATDYYQNNLVNTSILLVDDNEIDREIASEILRHEGASVTSVTDGREAVSLVKRSDANAFDAILMDLTMDNMDGLEATRSIRKLPMEWTSFIPIIAMTALDSQDIETMTREAGMNGFLAKPISVSAVSRILIDTMRTQSRLMQEKLSSVEIRSNKDPLTGVKNISAYTDDVADLSEQIRKGEKVEFAILEADLNNLKQVNDTYGHDMGDVYIRNCARILSECYKHSPVYRIGGDEFVVLMRNADYQLRDKLIQRLQNMHEESSRVSSIDKGHVSFAAGMADYIEGVDRTVGDVVKKADIAMYNNKRMIKRGGLIR